MAGKVLGLVAVVGLLLATAGAASAQVDRATLTGTVHDPQGAVIQKAQVKVTSLATNAVATATTNNEGTYPSSPSPRTCGGSDGVPTVRADRVAETGARSRLDLSLAVGRSAKR